MKISTIAGKPFVRLGSKTLPPPEAIELLRADVGAAADAVRRAERDLAAITSDYRRCLAQGEAPPREKLRTATAALADAEARHDHAQAVLDACRDECAQAAAASRVGALRAHIDALLARFPVEKTA